MPDALDHMADAENNRADDSHLGNLPESLEPEEQVRLRIGQKLNLALDEFEHNIGTRLLIVKLQARLERMQSRSPLAERFPL